MGGSSSGEAPYIELFGGKARSENSKGGGIILQTGSSVGQGGISGKLELTSSASATSAARTTIVAREHTHEIWRWHD